MFFVAVLLAFAEDNSYSSKAVKLMLFASVHQKTDSPYYKNVQNLVVLRSNAILLAKKICFDEEEKKKLANSTKISDKMTAAYSYGMGTISSIDDKLFELLVDDDNIVSIAARECFVYIANKKIKNFVVDQGPSPHADKAEKYQASCLWKKFMKLHNLFHNECNSYELQAFDELIKKVEEEESNKIFRKKIKSQLEKVDYYFPKNNFFESDQELEDNIPHDLVDPSSFTVKAIIKNVYFRKEEVLTF